MNIIIDYNRTIFDPETNTLCAGVSVLLENMSKRHALFLVSRNEQGRAKQFRSFGAEQYFQQVYFVDEKNMELFKKIGGNGNEVIVVGDSIRDEIKIGNTLGFITVRVRQGKFKDEIPTSELEAPTYEISSIAGLEAII